MACSICRSRAHNRRTCPLRYGAKSYIPVSVSVHPIRVQLRDVDGQPCAWIDGARNLHLKGEYYQQDHLSQFREIAAADAPIMAWLTPELDNEHDPNAVMVWINGGKAGYLPKEEAGAWHKPLRAVEAMTGRRVACRGALFLSTSLSGEETVEAIVNVPEPPSPGMTPIVDGAAAPAPVQRRTSWAPLLVVLAAGLLVVGLSIVVIIIALVARSAPRQTASAPPSVTTHKAVSTKPTPQPSSGVFKRP